MKTDPLIQKWMFSSVMCQVKIIHQKRFPAQINCVYGMTTDPLIHRSELRIRLLPLCYIKYFFPFTAGSKRSCHITHKSTKITMLGCCTKFLQMSLSVIERTESNRYEHSSRTLGCRGTVSIRISPQWMSGPVMMKKGSLSLSMCQLRGRPANGWKIHLLNSCPDKWESYLNNNKNRLNVAFGQTAI